MEADKVRGLISLFEDLSTHSASRTPSYCSSPRSSLVETREIIISEDKVTGRLVRLRDVIKSKLEGKKRGGDSEEKVTGQCGDQIELKTTKRNKAKCNVSKAKASEDKKRDNELKGNKKNDATVKEDNARKVSEDNNVTKVSEGKIRQNKAREAKSKLEKHKRNEAKLLKIKVSENHELINKSASELKNEVKVIKARDKNELKKNKAKENSKANKKQNNEDYVNEVTKSKNDVLLRSKGNMPSSLNGDVYKEVIEEEGRSSIVSQNREKFEKKMREYHDEIRKSNELRKNNETRRSHELKKINDLKKINEMKNNEVKNNEVKNNEVKNNEVKNNEVKNNEVKNNEVKNNEVKNNEIKNNEVKKNDMKNDELRNNEKKKNEMNYKDNVHNDLKNNEYNDMNNNEHNDMKNNEHNEMKNNAKHVIKVNETRNSEVKYTVAENSEVKTSETNNPEKNQRKEYYETWNLEVRSNENESLKNKASTHEMSPKDLRAANEMRKREFFEDRRQFPAVENEEMKGGFKLEDFEGSPESPYENIYSCITFEALHESYKPKNYNQNELVYETIPDFEEEVQYDTLFPPEVYDDDKAQYENVFLPHSKTRLHYENFTCRDLRCCSSTFYIPLQNHQCPHKTDSSYYSGDEDEDELEVESNDLVCPPRLVQRVGVVNPKLDDEITVYENFIVRGTNTDPNITINLFKDKKDYIVEELIHTENAYVDSLEFVIKNYMIYLKENTDSSKYKYIFTNIDNIYLETKQFKDDIKRWKYKYVEIGQTFLRHKNLFARYPVYCKNNTKSLQLINEDFKDIITKREKELEDKLGLSSHLLKPIQRLGKYELLLKNLHACLKEDQEELGQKSVEAAILMIQRVTRRGNDLITLTTIEDNPHTIVDTGGLLLKESFKLQSPKKLEVMLFLFEKILIFTTKKKQEGYMYYTYIPLESLARQNPSVESNIFVIEDYHMKKRHGDPPFVLEAKEAELKEKWTKQIDELLWMQLRKRKEEAQSAQRHRLQSLTSLSPTEVTTKKAANQKTKEKKRLFSFSLLTK